MELVPIEGTETPRISKRTDPQSNCAYWCGTTNVSEVEGSILTYNGTNLISPQEIPSQEIPSQEIPSQQIPSQQIPSQQTIATIESLISDALAKQKSDEHEHASQQSNLDVEDWNIYTFLYLAVAQASPLRAALLISCSFFILTMQSFVLMMIVFESNTQKCLSNDDCNYGTWCAGTGEGMAGGAGESGSCYDCHFAVNRTNSWAVSAIESWEIDDGISYCKQHDEHIGYCDVIYQNLLKVSLATVCVLVFVSVMTMEQLLKDIDQAATSISLLWNYLERENTSTAEAKMAVVYVLHECRRWVLMGLVSGATAAVIVTDELSIVNVMLNGVAMGSMMILDDVLILMVPSDGMRLIQKVATESELRRAGRKADEAAKKKEIALNYTGILPGRVFVETWTFRRMYGVLMSIFTITSVLYVFDFADASAKIGLTTMAHDTESNAYPVSSNYNLCGNMQSAFLLAPLFSLAIGVVEKMFKLLCHLHRFIITGVSPHPRDLILPVCGPLLAYAFMVAIIRLALASYIFVAISLFDSNMNDDDETYEDHYS